MKQEEQPGELSPPPTPRSPLQTGLKKSTNCTAAHPSKAPAATWSG